MASLLNPIIALGGTTAREVPVTGADLAGAMAAHPGRACWHVAKDGNGRILGVQSAGPHPGLPPDLADIATFTRVGMGGCGIGTTLFQVTRAACRALGYRAINAAIRSDNTPGLRFYDSLGFIDWANDRAARLASGQVTGKTFKRYEL